MDKSILFDILQKDIHVDGKKVPARKAIVNAQTGSVIGIVGNSYIPVSNMEILQHYLYMIEQSGLQYKVGPGALIRGGSRTIMEVSFPSMTITDDSEDTVLLKTYLLNSFDGQSSARIRAGLVRLVCKNGMTIEENELTLSYKHIGNVSKNLVEGLRSYLDGRLKAAQKFIAQLREREFGSVEEMEEIIEGSDWIAHKYHEQLFEELHKQKIRNAWYLYNVFTYVITHVLERNMESKLKLYKRLNLEIARWGKKAGDTDGRQL